VFLAKVDLDKRARAIVPRWGIYKLVHHSLFHFKSKAILVDQGLLSIPHPITSLRLRKLPAMFWLQHQRARGLHLVEKMYDS